MGLLGGQTGALDPSSTPAPHVAPVLGVSGGANAFNPVALVMLTAKWQASRNMAKWLGVTNVIPQNNTWRTGHLAISHLAGTRIFGRDHWPESKLGDIYVGPHRRRQSPHFMQKAASLAGNAAISPSIASGHHHNA
jgi:hypothetical protein